MPDLPAKKAALRSELRRRRRSLSGAQQQRAAESVALALAGLPEWSQARHIALYMAADGELDTGPLASLARGQGKHLYLPVIADGDALAFAHWERDAPLAPNRFDIPEPGPGAARVEAAALDLVCLPLVAWDRSGARLGMGGGYYDRALGDVGGPLLVGLAHACQETAQVPRDGHDVCLDIVATDGALLDCRGTN